VNKGWQAVRLFFAAVIVGGGIMILALAAGAADPPRAGPLKWQHEPIAPLVIPPNHTTIIATLDLPAAPYTLEVTAQFSALSDPGAKWGIVFPQSNSGIFIDSQGFFSVPPSVPDSMPFMHIRPVGHPNKIALNVEQNGQATLRINDEIAWRGEIPPESSAELRAWGGRTRESEIVIPQVSLFYPQSN
jgi:hypothetical protein